MPDYIMKPPSERTSAEKIQFAINRCGNLHSQYLDVSLRWPDSWVKHAEANRKLERYNAAIRKLLGMVGR